ncbi:MAG: stage II sporulation protein R [Clostridia bacterium]|nr:stage II sporulation protein R [Clostridia bacterium]
MKKIILVSMVVLSIAFFIQRQPSLLASAPAEIPTDPEQLIRFHVIANSDAPADQELKRKVRDRVVKILAKELKNAQDIGEARKIALANLDRMETLAREEIKSSGKPYAVEAELGTFEFPTKSYGKFTLPAGTYQAVKITLGKGQGKNWWCVLFPPLCFVDITHSLAANPVLAQTAVNTMASGKDKGPDYDSLTPEQGKVEIRFKTLDLWQSFFSKH